MQNELTQDEPVRLYKDAPIRYSMPEDGLCKNCVYVLHNCNDVICKKKLVDGYNCIIECDGFEDYR